MPYWLWRVPRINELGSALCREKKRPDQRLYECHLYGPAVAKHATSMAVPMRPYDVVRTNLIIKTPVEKAKDPQTKFRDRMREKRRTDKTTKQRRGEPLTALLRDDNILLKGFALTTGNRIPPIVRKHMEESTR